MDKIIFIILASSFLNAGGRQFFQDDQSLWIALFGLAITGILALYLSSEQVKTLDKKYKRMIESQHEIEKKQELLLQHIGTKIEASTKGMIQDMEFFQEQRFENITPLVFQKEIEKWQKSETLLLDATHELQDFLQIKSNNLKLKNESYKVNNILNETFSLVSTLFKQKVIELVYIIDPEVASTLKGDSKRIEQILKALLENIIDGTYNDVITLKMSLSASNNILIEICNKNKQISDEEITGPIETFDYSHQSDTDKHLGFYIATQLIKLMGGTLTLEALDKKGISYIVELPQKIQNKTEDQLSTKYNKKRILIATKHNETGEAIEGMLKASMYNAKHHSKETFREHLPNFFNYDLIIIDSEILSDDILDKLTLVQKEHELSIICLQNIFETKNNTIKAGHAQTILHKPLQKTQLFYAIEDIFSNIKSQKPIDKPNKVTSLKQEESNIVPENIAAVVETQSKNVKHELKDEARREPTKAKNINAEIKKEKITIEEIISEEEEKAYKVGRKDFRSFANLNILIVEDNIMNQKILLSMLEESSMKVEVANNGREALEAIKNNPYFDIIFMDTNMPVLDGYEATKKIRAIYTLQQLYIIAIDSIGFQDNMDKNHGFNSYLRKPFSIDKLYESFVNFGSKKPYANKHSMNKINQQQRNKDILDIDKGIRHAQTAVFYKELLKETFLTIDNIDNEIMVYIKDNKYEELKHILINMSQLSDTIGARGLKKAFDEMNQLFYLKKEHKLSELMPYLQKELSTLQKEISRYLL